MTVGGLAVIEPLRSGFNDELPAVPLTGDTGPDRLRDAAASGLGLLHRPQRTPANQGARLWFGDESTAGTRGAPWAGEPSAGAPPRHGWSGIPADSKRGRLNVRFAPPACGSRDPVLGPRSDCPA